MTTNYKVIPMLKRFIKEATAANRGQVKRIFFYTVFATIYPFMAVILPKIAIGIIEVEKEEAARTLVYAMSAYFVVAALLTFFTKTLNQTIQAENMRIRLIFLGRLCNKIQTMDYQYVEDATFYEKNLKAMNACNDNEHGMEGVGRKISLLPAEILSCVGMMVYTCFLSPFVLLAIILHVAVTMWVSKNTHDFQYSKKEELTKAERKRDYYKGTTNDFTFGKDIRIFDLRERILINYRNEIESVTEINRKIANREFINGFAALLTLFLTNVVMYGILIYKAYNGLSISSFTMYTTLIISLMTNMLRIGEDLAFVRNEGQYVDDFFKFLDEKLIEEGEITEVPEKVEIVFDHVTFRYPNTEKDIFKDFCFTIHAGERLAVVGVNGAGKSTFVKLICGLFAPTKGHIYINGIDISRYSKKCLYSMFGTVFQDFNILAFTIEENVTCTAEKEDETSVYEALESVGLREKVHNFEQGLNQMMLKVVDENGTDFSGGERQKLAIARALYKNAPMVIMDEPTAALDALAEAEIYEGFSKLVEGKTALYVSHRLASTKFCDKIALFDNEGVKECGTHEELMEKKGLYYDMFVVQGKYYQTQEEQTA